MAGSLRDADVLVVDCQSTGASPEQGSLLELGWRIVQAAQSEPAAVSEGEPAKAERVSSRLIALPPGARIPRAVTRITGLRAQDMDAAVDVREAWADLLQQADELATATGGVSAPTVIHYARFELAFLRDLHARFEPSRIFPFDVVCTHEIARRLLPDLPRRGLRALAGYYGLGVEQLRRSHGHVEATAFVWRHLIDELQEHEVCSWDQLHLWLSDTAPVSSRGRKSFPIPRETRLSVPDQPGIYRLLRRSGDVLYVGKATSLRRRVNSYFTKQRGIHERHLEMLTQVRDLSVTVTATTLEAALLECDEIKSLEPPYNKQLREVERAAWFASPDLADARSEADAQYRVGPLPSRLSLAALAALAAELGDQQGHSRRRTARALGVPAAFAPEDAPFGEGLALFVSRHLDGAGARGEPLRRLMALSKALWQAHLAGQLELDGDADDQERAWDPERIARHLTRAVLQAGQLVRRARWLCLLSEATVAWSEPGAGDQRRLLVLQRAAVGSQGDLELGSALPIPAGAGRRRSERQRDFDVAAYDRLRVLSTELKRVTSQGGRAAVCLGPGRVLSGAALERLLRWI